MSSPAPAQGWRLWGRSPGDFVLFGVTAVELAYLVRAWKELGTTDWIYVCSHLLVLVIALVRRPALVQDRSIGAAVAVLVSYAYAYAQVVMLNWRPGREAWPEGGLVLTVLGALLSLAGLISLGRLFGVRPAMRGLATKGMYRVVRHPIYFAYVIQDIGYNLGVWSPETLALVAAGWASIVYRIYAEERMLRHNPEWEQYAGRVRYRLLPGIW